MIVVELNLLSRFAGFDMDTNITQNLDSEFKFLLGVDKPISLLYDGYQYKLDQQCGPIITWKCYQRYFQCQATLTTTGHFQSLKIIDFTPHDCEKFNNNAAVLFQNRLKLKVMLDLKTPIELLYKQEFYRLFEYGHVLPDHDIIIDHLNKIRNETLAGLKNQGFNTNLAVQDLNQSSNSDTENFYGFEEKFFCSKCQVQFEGGINYQLHLIEHISLEKTEVSLQRLSPDTIRYYTRKNLPAPKSVRKSRELLKLKLHRVIKPDGHQIYQADNLVNSADEEEVAIPKNEDTKDKLATEESGNINMDNGKESPGATDSPQKADQNERGSNNSTPLSNGPKEGHDESSTNLPPSNAEDDEEENNTGDSGVSSPGDSKKDIILKSPIEKEVKREPVDPPKSPTGSDFSDAPTEPVLSQPTLRVRRSDDLFERGQFENIDKLVQQPKVKQESGEELYMCSVCPDRFSSGAALEAHMARTGHYSISAHPEQPSQSAQGPMQQLAQQVQRIPASFNSQPFRSEQPVPNSQMYGQNAYPPRVNMLGPQVKLTPVGPSSSPQTSLPNLPPGIQLQKRPAQQNIETPQPKQRREDIPTSPSVKLPSSITLVRPSQQSTPVKKDNSVADILANRGITMIPSGGKALPGASMSRVPIASGGGQLNSSVSITPSARSQQQSYGGRGLPTVDLTSDPDHHTSHHPMQTSPHHAQQPPQRMRNRAAPSGLTPPHGGRPPMRVSCQVCDKVFSTQEALNQHLPSHRGIHNKLPFECKECTAQYPTAQGLAVHKQKYHKPSASAILDMAIPVVDLKQNGVVHKLTSLGVRNFIPLAQLHNQQNGGQFCLPIVSVELANNPAFCNINGIGASNLLPLGPLKNLTP